MNKENLEIGLPIGTSDIEIRNVSPSTETPQSIQPAREIEVFDSANQGWSAKEYYDNLQFSPELS